MVKKPSKKPCNFTPPEPIVINNGFKKGVTTVLIDVSDSPNEEHGFNMLARGRCAITIMVVDKTLEEINRLHEYNKLMGKTKIGSMGYVFED